MNRIPLFLLASCLWSGLCVSARAEQPRMPYSPAANPAPPTQARRPPPTAPTGAYSDFDMYEKPSPTDQPGEYGFGLTADEQVTEVLPAADYIQWDEVDPIARYDITWDPASLKFLYVSKTIPYVVLSGTARPDCELNFDGRWIRTINGRFQIKVPIFLDPHFFAFRVYYADRTFRTYRFLSAWNTLPPAVRANIPAMKASGAVTSFKNAAFVQLYSDKAPVTFVDLDAQKHAHLTFRIFSPPLPDEAYDGWRLTIRNTQGRVVGEVARYGMPPAFLDWREVASNLYGSGTYTYQLNLYRDEAPFAGMSNHFDAVEGLSAMDHPYLPAVQFEPKEEIGYYFFRNDNGVSYSNMYVGADLPIVFWNRFILRPTGLMSLHTPNPEENLTFTRIMGGFRFFGAGRSAVLGDPFLFHLDVYLGHTGFTVGNSARLPVHRYTQLGILVEPHMVLWQYHYLIPWVEFATKTELEQQRFSFGLNYEFFIRPWSVKLGMGFSYDDLFKFEGAEGLQFQVMRAMATFTFFL